MTGTGEPTRVRNAERTRLAALDAAQALFACRGYAGTSMRDIVNASGVSAPLIHHHFGSKDGLYTAVRRRVVDGYAARFPDAARVTDRPVDVGEEVGRFYEFLVDNDTLLRLNAWTRLEGNQRTWPGEAELNRALVRRIEVAQERGLVRPDVDPRFLTVMLVGVVVYWLDQRSVCGELFAEPPDDRAYLSQAVALFERGIAPRGPSPTEPGHAPTRPGSLPSAEPPAPTPGVDP